MARKSKPWWREERGQWYVQHNGRQVPLGPDKDEAEKKWHTLMALAGKDTAGADSPFKIIADERLEWVRRHKKEKTYRVYKLLLQEFHNLHGNVPVNGAEFTTIRRFRATAWNPQNLLAATFLTNSDMLPPKVGELHVKGSPSRSKNSTAPVSMS